jgi:hypothetical protein
MAPFQKIMLAEEEHTCRTNYSQKNYAAQQEI